MGCFSGRLMSAASDQKLFCELCSPFNCSFDEFVGEKVVSPSYSSTILTPPLSSIFSLKFFLYEMHIQSLVMCASKEPKIYWSYHPIACMLSRFRCVRLFATLSRHNLLTVFFFFLKTRLVHNKWKEGIYPNNSTYLISAFLLFLLIWLVAGEGSGLFK